jgi:hypothetical protein
MAKALSLHVGISVSNGHAGPLGAARGCDAVASELAAIAEQHGYARREVLIDEEATLQNVTSSFESLSNALDHGDLLLFTLAGHGRQLAGPGHGCDPHDHAFVLYDDYLIDGDVYHLCEGVSVHADIVIVAEGCFSGSISTKPPGASRFTTKAGDLGGPCPGRPLLDSNVMVLAATSPTGIASGVLNRGLPLFSRALIDNLPKSTNYRELRDNINRNRTNTQPECELNEDLVDPASDLPLRKPFKA